MLPLLLLSSLLPGVILAQEASSQNAMAAAQLARGSEDRAKGNGKGKGAGTGSRSSVPFGQVITKCTEPNAFALSFDDGPFDFTKTLLQMLNQNKLKATFFVNGQNFGSITDKGDILKEMLDGGHQIGSHTYAPPAVLHWKRRGTLTRG